jgi:mRNA interferase MazF
MKKWLMKRGDVVWVNFGLGFGCEQGGKRPALIVQNDVGNKHSPTTIVLPLTTKKSKHELPTHSIINVNDVWNLAYGEQIRVIDKNRIISDVVDSIKDMTNVNRALSISIGI